MAIAGHSGAPCPAAAGKHQAGGGPSEAYGFVGSIAAAAAALVYLVWAYAPEPWLRSLGATYFPNKHWALAVPAFVAVAVAQGLVFYMASNFLLAPPPACFDTISDEHARERSAASARRLLLKLDKRNPSSPSQTLALTT